MYDRYLARQQLDIERFRKDETKKISPNINYKNFSGLSNENNEKLTKLRKLRKQSKKFEDDFWSGIIIEKLHKSIERAPAHHMEAIFVTGMKELTTSNNKSINHDANILL